MNKASLDQWEAKVDLKFNDFMTRLLGGCKGLEEIEILSSARPMLEVQFKTRHITNLTHQILGEVLCTKKLETR